MSRDKTSLYALLVFVIVLLFYNFKEQTQWREQTEVANYLIEDATVFDPHREPTIRSITHQGMVAIGDLKTDWNFHSEYILNYRFRFSFCAIPKNGCTVWKMFMKRSLGLPDWRSGNIHHPIKSNLTLPTSLVEVQKALDADLYSIVFVRDPITRFLSAYIDRCVEMNEWYRCGSKDNKPGFSLRDTVKAIQKRYQRNKHVDPHFRRQVDHCGMKHQPIDFIGYFETMKEDSTYILKHLHLWKLFGESGWGADASDPFLSTHLNTTNHITSDHQTTIKVCKFYTEQTLKQVRIIYMRDFERFGHGMHTDIHFSNSPQSAQPSKTINTWRSTDDWIHYCKTKVDKKYRWS